MFDNGRLMDNHKVDRLCSFLHHLIISTDCGCLWTIHLAVHTTAFGIVIFSTYHCGIGSLCILDGALAVMTCFLSGCLTIQKINGSVKSALWYSFFDGICRKDLLGLIGIHHEKSIKQICSSIQNSALFRHFIIVHCILSFQKFSKKCFRCRNSLCFALGNTCNSCQWYASVPHLPYQKQGYRFPDCPLHLQTTWRHGHSCIL